MWTEMSKCKGSEKCINKLDSKSSEDGTTYQFLQRALYVYSWDILFGRVVFAWKRPCWMVIGIED
jgi:hypothetical protein